MIICFTARRYFELPFAVTAILYVPFGVPFFTVTFPFLSTERYLLPTVALYVRDVLALAPMVKDWFDFFSVEYLSAISLDNV